MRKLLLFFSILLLSAAMANAQYFAGGSLGFNTNGGKTEAGDTENDLTSTTSFHFSPKGGIVYSEDVLLGISLGISFYRAKEPGNPEVIRRTFGYHFAPFARYYALELGKLSVFGEGRLGLTHSSSKRKEDGTTTQSPTTTGLHLSLYPGLSYNLSDHISLEMDLNMLRFSAARTVEKRDQAGNDSRTVRNSFGFNAGLNNIANTDNITIGAIVRF